MNPRTFTDPFTSQYPTAFTEGKGQLRLMARCSIGELEIIEANAETQTARLKARGHVQTHELPFRSIYCVTLKWDNGIVEQCFGTPKVSRPESIEFIQYSAVQ